MLQVNSFSQEREITVHHYMFEIHYTVQQMELNHFLIPSDSSHKVYTQELIKEYRCDLVKDIDCSNVKLESEHYQFLETESCIDDDQRLYWNDIATQLRIIDKEGNNLSSLPDAIAITVLLNPLLGGKTRV